MRSMVGYDYLADRPQSWAKAAPAVARRARRDLPVAGPVRRPRGHHLQDPGRGLRRRAGRPRVVAFLQPGVRRHDVRRSPADHPPPRDRVVVLPAPATVIAGAAATPAA